MTLEIGDNSTHRLALFDFDGTLIKTDSFVKIAEALRGRWRLIGCCVLSSPWLAAWKLGLIDGGRAKQQLFKRLYRGITAEEFASKCDHGAIGLLKYQNAEMIATLNRHFAEGDRVIVVSASIDQWVRPVARLLGVGEVVATEVEVDSDGCLTGRFSTRNCNGTEKVRRIHAYLGNTLDSYGSIAVYGDSAGDEAMMRLTRRLSE